MYADASAATISPTYWWHVHRPKVSPRFLAVNQLPMMAVFTGPPVAWNKPCIIWHTKKNVLHNAAFVTIEVDTPMNS